MLLLIFTTACVTAVNFITESDKELTACLAECAKSAEKENLEDLNKQYNKLQKIWHKKRRIYDIILRKDYIDTINKHITNMSASLYQNDFRKISEEIEECMCALNIIKEKEKINFENIL